MAFSPLPEEWPAIPTNLLGPGEKYHCFISHSSDDLEASKYLYDTLRGLGLMCFHSEYDFEPGGTIVSNITRGIEQSHRVIAIISPSMMESSWVEFEIANSRSKGSEKNEVIFIPILYNISPSQVPAYVKEINYLEANDPQFWSKLLKAITVSVPLTATIPAGNIAHGIAWSYYYGYLSFVLPGLVKRCMESEFASNKSIRILPKMMIILPETCKCPGDVKKMDKDVQFVGNITFKASRAGKVGRDYSSSVYKVTDPDTGDEFFAVMEYATPLMAMYEMEQGRIANLDALEKIRQMKLFQEKMNEILDQSLECRGKAAFVEYKDHSSGESGPERLATVLARRIREELQRLQRAEEMTQ